MRIVFLIVFALLSELVIGQTPFQGTIVYNLHASKEKKDGELTIQFGVNKVKVQFKEKEDYDKSYLIIDLDSGRLLTVDTENKTFRSKKLAVVDPTNEKMAVAKKIAGYETTPVRADAPGFAGVLSAIYMGNTTFYEANDLYYSIPAKFRNAPELVFVHNNHVVLGAEIEIASSMMGEDEEETSTKEPMKITVEAKSVTKTVFVDGEFLIPPDYTKASRYWGINDSTAIMSIDSADTTMMNIDSTAMADTTMMYMDSASTAPKEPIKSKTKTKTSPTAPKKKTVTKGEAIKPKKN